jgi:hypothetical protein
MQALANNTSFSSKAAGEKVREAYENEPSNEPYPSDNKQKADGKEKNAEWLHCMYFPQLNAAGSDALQWRSVASNSAPTAFDRPQQ